MFGGYGGIMDVLVLVVIGSAIMVVTQCDVCWVMEV